MENFSILKPNALAEISRDIGQVFFASMLIGPLVSGNTDVLILFSGLAFSAVAWIVSLLLSK